MEQLKMYWLPGGKIEKRALPEGYSFSNYREQSEKYDWAAICREGLIDDSDGAQVFDQVIGKEHEKDVLFLDYKGEHIGTVTPIWHEDKRIGEVHMVSLRKDYRGRGLSAYLNEAALDRLARPDMRYIYLTTDEWRVSAIKGYLTAGFAPVEYDTDMPERWAKMLSILKIPSVRMTDEEGLKTKVIYAEEESNER